MAIIVTEVDVEVVFIGCRTGGEEIVAVDQSKNLTEQEKRASHALT